MLRPQFDWVWQNCGNTFSDAEVGALVCPRALFMEVGNRDEFHDYHFAEAVAARIKSYFESCPGQFMFRVFDGTHEFGRDDVGIDFLMDHLL